MSFYAFQDEIAHYFLLKQGAENYNVKKYLASSNSHGKSSAICFLIYKCNFRAGHLK